MKQRLGLPYDYSGVLMSTYRKVLGSLGINEADLLPEDVAILQNKLFCSTIMAMAVINSGHPARFAPNPVYVWPRDFIISDWTEKIAKYIVE